MSYQNIEIAQVVAMSDNHAIGKDNDLPWHIPADLQHFKQLTINGVVIMGRKTFESMGAKPLPKRTNIVISQNVDYQTNYSSVIILHDLSEAIAVGAKFAKEKGLNSIWIIGGERLFAETMPISDRLEITQVATHIENATAFYPDIFENFHIVSQSDWQYDENSQLKFRFVSYQK